MIGDSAAAGVGAATHKEALTGQVAAALAGLTGRSVGWQVISRPGATVRTIRRDLVSRLDDSKPGVVLVVAGANDALRLRRPRVFRQDTARLISDVRDRVGPDVPMMLAGLPPLNRFPSLPLWTRIPLGTYAWLLDRQLARLARRGRLVFHLPVGHLPVDPLTALSPADNFHPTPLGYRAWARSLAAQMATLLDTLETAPAFPGPTEHGISRVNLTRTHQTGKVSPSHGRVT